MFAAVHSVLALTFWVFILTDLAGARWYLWLLAIGWTIQASVHLYGASRRRGQDVPADPRPGAGTTADR